MPQNISYSDGRVVPDAVVVVWDDNHNERVGFYRAFWAANPDATCGSPVIGYCSPGGSHRRISAVVQEVRHLYPDEPVYRNGKIIRS